MRCVWHSISWGANKLVLPCVSEIPGRRIRIGIVGLGKMGLLHWRTLQRFPEVAITVVVDTDPAKALWAKAQGVPFFRKSEDLIGHVDAVVIATPADQHVACALPLLTAGIHCLIEKPITLSFDDGQHIVTAAARHAAILAIGHSERFNPALQQIRNPTGSALCMIEVFRMAATAHAHDPFADVVQDLMIHDLDWALDVMRQSPANFQIRDARWTEDALSYACCELNFAEGMQIVLTSSFVEFARRRELILHSRDGMKRPISMELAMHQAGVDPLTLQAHAFLELLHGRCSPIATGAEALRVLTMAEQIRARCQNTYAAAL